MKNEIRDYPQMYGEPSTRGEMRAVLALVIGVVMAWTAISVAFGVWLGWCAS